MHPPPILTPPIFGTPQLFPGQPGEAEKIPSHLKKSCAHGPAGGEGCPGSTYGLARGFDSRLCAYVLNLARARFCGPAWPVWPGPRPPVRSWPCLAGWWGEGGRIYPAIRRLYRAHKTPPARLAGGPGLLPGGVWRAGFQSPFQSVRQQLPRVSPCAGPVLALVLVVAVSGFGPALQAVGAGRLRRAAAPVLRLAPLPVRRGPCPVPVLLPCRSGAVRSRPPVPVRLLRGPGLQPGVFLRFRCRSSPARPFPKATAIFPPPTPGRKFPAIFPARYFMRAV